RSPLLLKKIGKGVAVDTWRWDVGTDAIDNQHPERKQHTSAQLGNFEDILETSQQTFKHRR
ncbi:MAG: hypothetical protein OEW32_10935, partial [Nitrospira sp.]|nr:hypothetical protein [Nitrospira sp.]